MKFSVIIPNYNNGKYLKRCLESVLKQTYTNYEIIFIDDMSTDNSLEIAKSLLDKPHKIVELKSKRLNGGARNEGIIRAKGDYCIWIDSDDYFKDNKVFEDINKALGDKPDVLFLGYDTYFGINSMIPYIPEHTRLNDAIMHCVCAIWTKVIKTDILKECLFPEGTLFEDRIQHYRVLLKCNTFKNLNRSVILWDRSTSISTSRLSNYNSYEFNFASELYRFIPEVKDEELRKYFMTELVNYTNHCKEMVDNYDRT